MLYSFLNGGIMKITAFNGTHRTGESNTAILIDHFLQGASSAGAQIEHVRLAKTKIQPCTACKACWQKTPGKCVIRDDMSTLVEKFTSSDVVVLASPIYADNVSGLLKTFIDRLIPTGDPHWELDEKGESRHCRRYSKPTKLVAISNCGYPEQSHFDVLRLYFRRMCRNMHLELCGEIYRGAGALLAGGVPEFSEYLSGYLRLVENAGQQVVQQGRVSETLAEKLEAPIIPLPGFNQIFLAKVNQIVDAQISKIA
ncbi:MAG TPA: flavodoxin family protein [Candidatus Riflebacteria bacterium]|jgi:multimeric flavodoxin WrbA|nr:flavodoxin family protein [Candidatus Riflebacteria bacterium]